MLQLYGAMSERRGIHDVVSSFSWVMNRVVIGSRGTVLGIVLRVVVMEWPQGKRLVRSRVWIEVGLSSRTSYGVCDSTRILVRCDVVIAMRLDSGCW